MSGLYCFCTVRSLASFFGIYLQQLSIMRLYIVLSFLLSAAFANTHAQGIEFEHDLTFTQILAKAKQQNRLVFMDCYTAWCGPCKRLAAAVFPDSAVGEYFNANFINAKFDMEKGEGVEIANRYQIRAYPTLLWLDGDGNVKHKLVGGTDAPGLIAQGKKAADPTPGILSGMKKQYNEGKRDVAFVADFLNTLNSAGENYDAVFNEYLSKITEKELQDTKHTKTIFTLTKDVKSPGLAYLMRNKEYYIKNMGEEALTQKVNAIAEKAIAEAPKANDPALFDAGINLLKTYKAPDHPERIMRNQLSYYAATNNWGEYDQIATQFVKKYGTKNTALVNDICWNYYLNITDRAQLIKANKWAYQAINQEQKYTYCLTYAYLVYKLEDYKEAQKACDYAILRAKEENTNPSSAEFLKGAIEKSLKSGK